MIRHRDDLARFVAAVGSSHPDKRDQIDRPAACPARPPPHPRAREEQDRGPLDGSGGDAYKRHRVGRRPWLIAAALLALVGASAAGGRPGPATAQDRPPDVVVVLLDDMRASDWRALPETRRLVGGGFYENIFYPTASCCPARASLLTGRYAHNHGVKRTIGGAWPDFRPHEGDTLAVALDRAGYRTVLVGKYMNRYGRDDPRPPGWDDWRPFVRGDDRAGLYRTRRGYSTDVLRDRAVGAVAGAPADEPLFLWFAPVAPHGPAIYDDRHAALYPDAAGVDRDRLRTLAAVDEAVAAIAEAMGAGEQGSRWEAACVFVLSDNGYLLDEHGVAGGKNLWWDGASRVPLLARCPGVEPDARMAATIDLAPTVLRAAGARAWWGLDGRALQDRWDREAILLEGWGKLVEGRQRGWRYQAIRTGDALYVEALRPDGDRRRFLFDLAADPGETRNLVRDGVDPDPALVARLDALRGCAGDGCRAADGGP